MRVRIPGENLLRSDEQRLVQRAQAGDQAAFEQVVKLYQRRAFAVAIGMVGNAEDAMDVVQESFIKVHRYLDRFRGSSSFYTWLYRIVVNVSIDHLRKANRTRTVEYEEGRYRPGDERGPTQPADGPGVIGRKKLRGRVQEALAKLSPNHRAVILMREVQGLSYTEMAEAMRCSKGTIMSRLFHARRRMQQALRETMNEEELAQWGVVEAGSEA